MPCPSLFAVHLWFVLRSVSVSVAPGMTAPCGSATVPWMEPRNCANAGVPLSIMIAMAPSLVHEMRRTLADSLLTCVVCIMS
jgi:hypothetical protein